MHKLERLAGEHIHLRIEGTEQLHTVVGFSAEKRVPDDKRLCCSLLHGEDLIADLACLRLPSPQPLEAPEARGFNSEQISNALQ